MSPLNWLAFTSFAISSGTVVMSPSRRSWLWALWVVWLYCFGVASNLVSVFSIKPPARAAFFIELIGIFYKLFISNRADGLIAVARSSIS